jgi:hypothetical protein
MLLAQGADQSSFPGIPVKGRSFNPSTLEFAVEVSRQGSQVGSIAFYGGFEPLILIAGRVFQTLGDYRLDGPANFLKWLLEGQELLAGEKSLSASEVQDAFEPLDQRNGPARSSACHSARSPQPARPTDYWRRGWDSNPRYPYEHNSFRDCPNRPLWHPSERVLIGVAIAAGNRLGIRFPALTRGLPCVYSALSSAGPTVRRGSLRFPASWASRSFTPYGLWFPFRRRWAFCR